MTRVKETPAPGAIGDGRDVSAEMGGQAQANHTKRALITEAAAALAALGYVPIPLNADRKPIVRGWPDAEPGEDAARERFEQCTASGIAVVTRGFLALDLDRGHADGVDGVREFNRLRGHNSFQPHQTARTRRDGFHYYFKVPEGVALRTAPGALAPGIDLKAGRALVTVPPTEGYRWQGPPPWLNRVLPTALPIRVEELPDLPAWLVNLVRRPDPPPPTSRPHQPVRGTDAYARAVLERELAAVAGAGKGGRNAALFRAAARLGELTGAAMIPAEIAAGGLLAAAEACGLVRDDGRHAVEATIASGLRRGLGNPRRFENGGRRHAR